VITGWDFTAVSVVIGWDFMAVSAVTVLAGIFRPYFFLHRGL
jgi:hypothetical protein